MDQKNEKTSNSLDRMPFAIERGERLRFLRKSLNMTMQDFGNYCGISRTTVYCWEKGINRLTEKGADKVIQAVQETGLQASVLWLLQGLGESPCKTYSEKNFLSDYQPSLTLTHGEVQDRRFNYLDIKLDNEIALFKRSYANCLVSCIHDRAMYPLYQLGDYVGGRILPMHHVQVAEGLDCIVRLKEGTTLIRRVKVEKTQIMQLSLYGTNIEAAIEHPPLRYLKLSYVADIAPIIRIWRRNVKVGV